ncbi:MAG: iron dicitrate transport regulator FecR [Nitrosomonas sp.]|nr:MAG: iron dicitrate transport regulator FecR [Nitrosomonas sp.]
MQKPEPPVLQPFKFVFSWRRFFLHFAIMGFCVILGLLTWYFSKPQSIRFYETKAEPLMTSVVSGIDLALDAGSSVAVKDSHPMQVELFKGSAYFEINTSAVNTLEVKVGRVVIRDIGTRFSIRMNKDGSANVAVAEGYVKIYVSSGAFQINALEQADFDDHNISKHRLVTERDIAPWHH